MNLLPQSSPVHKGRNPKGDSSAQRREHRLHCEAVVVAPEGILIHARSIEKSKVLALLTHGSNLVGESVEFVSQEEAWLYIIEPVNGWCPIVRARKTFLSITSGLDELES